MDKHSYLGDYWCKQTYFKRLVILSYFSVSVHLAGFGIYMLLLS